MIDIEPVSLGISLLALLAFVAPFYFHHRKQSKRKTQQREIMESLAKTHQLNLNEVDYWRNLYGIGIDLSKKKLLYAKFDANPLTHLVNLDQCCELSEIKKTHQTGQGKNKNVVLDYLALKLDGEKEVVLEFYDSDIFSDNDGEHPLMQKWQIIIQSCLTKLEKVPELN
ncbi:hypothetical protein [Pararhodonellum marinum]|uniref:hypothetical protein n=1 Tax=Pararhodonellum marinum TaxID=2755358 RepID=UPI00188F6367|nr:hypothetical protein [Pararhodonellum marinum]